MSLPPPDLVLAFDDEPEPARGLADALGVPCGLIRRHRFPDGELRLHLPPALPEHVVIHRSLHPPNDRLVELLIATPAARELGARRVSLAIPYLAYMRQDIAFTPGEAVSQRHVAGLLARVADHVVTVDPHLHRIASLDEVMPPGTGVSLSAAPALGAWLAQRVPGAVLLGPDEESAQWVAEAARAVSPALPHAWCLKVRHGDRDVRVTLPPALDLAGRPVVLIDDMASTGRTLIAAAALCHAAGAASVDVAITHALMVDDAVAQLQAAGIRHVWSADTVAHASNAIPVAGLMAGAWGR